MHDHIKELAEKYKDARIFFISDEDIIFLLHLKEH